jgi:hypothetical protein
MEARRLIEKSSFEPETLHVIFTAFDAAWSQIENRYNGDAETGRLRLAHAMLIVAREGSRDPERLKTDALQVMALGGGIGAR